MAVSYSVRILLWLASFVFLCDGLCQLHPVNNSLAVCETRYNVERHEMVGGLKTPAEVADVCSVYPEYEACLTALINDCPKDESFLDMQGYDQESTIIAFKGFCADREVYLSGVPCYTKSFPAIRACFDGHSAGRDAALLEVHSTKEWDKFYQTLCPVQWAGAECVANSLGGCSPDVQRVMKNLAYSLMHGRCKISKYGTFVSDYDKKYGSSATRLSKLSPLAVSLISLIASLSLFGKL